MYFLPTTIRKLSAQHGVAIEELVEHFNNVFPNSVHSAYDVLSHRKAEEGMASFGKSAAAGNQTGATKTETGLPRPGAAPSTNLPVKLGALKMNSENKYDQQSTELWAARQWDNDAELRAEFNNDRATWIAYAHADAQGFCKTTGASQ